MSKYSASKVSSVLIGLSLMAVVAYPAFAQDSTAAGTAKKPLLQQKINIKQERVENAVEALREKVASRTSALKLKLQTFRDQKKAVIAERVNNNLNRINQNQTEQMQKHLAVMTTILDKLETRVNKSAPDVKDPARAKIAIAKARTNIATTSAAVTTQAQKDYTVQITSEAKVRTDIKIQRDQLFKDLQSVRKMVIDTKQSVAEAIRTAKSGQAASGSALLKEGTNSGQQ